VLSSHLTTHRFTQGDVLAVTRLRKDVLQTWMNRGVIALGDQNPGTGRRRLYSPLDIVKLAIRNSRLTLSVLIFLVIAGTLAYRAVPKEAEPDVAIPIMYVSLVYQGISPEDAERLLLRPVESQLKSLKELQAPLAQRGYSLAALSYDSPEILTGFAAKTGIGYTLLSDQKSVMIDAFGLRDPNYAAGSYAFGVPKASILLVDTKGVLRWKSVATDYKIRADNATILKAVDALR